MLNQIHDCIAPVIIAGAILLGAGAALAVTTKSGVHESRAPMPMSSPMMTPVVPPKVYPRCSKSVQDNCQQGY